MSTRKYFFQRNLQIEGMNSQPFLKKKFVNKIKENQSQQKKNNKKKKLFSQLSQNNNSTEKTLTSMKSTLLNNQLKTNQLGERLSLLSSKIESKENTKNKKQKKKQKNSFKKFNSLSKQEYMNDYSFANKIHLKSFFNDTKNQDSVQNTKDTRDCTAQSGKFNNDQIDKQICNLKKNIRNLNNKNQNNFLKEILKQKDIIKILKVLNLYFREKNQNLDVKDNYNYTQNIITIKKTLFSQDSNYVNMQQKVDQNIMNVQNMLFQDSGVLQSYQNSKHNIQPLMSSTQNISNVEQSNQGQEYTLLNESEMDLINDIKLNDDYNQIKRSLRITYDMSQRQKEQPNLVLLQQILCEIKQVKGIVECQQEKKISIKNKSEFIKPKQRPLIKVDLSKLHVFKKES